jgi:hypothetical protein
MKKLVVIIMAICLLACLLCVPSFALTVSSDDVIRVYGQKADGDKIILNGYKSFAEGWEAAIDYAEDHSSMEENGY